MSIDDKQEVPSLLIKLGTAPPSYISHLSIVSINTVIEMVRKKKGRSTPESNNVNLQLKEIDGYISFFALQLIVFSMRQNMHSYFRTRHKNAWPGQPLLYWNLLLISWVNFE